MKLFKFGLNIWILLTSTLSFLAGWIMIAHAPKPGKNSTAQSVFATPMPTFAPLPDIGINSGSNNGNFPQSPLLSIQPNFLPSAPMPVFRTGGS